MFMSRRSIKLILIRFRRWKELVFLLVFSATGGMGPVATTVYKKLASVLARKRKMNTAAVYFG